jgi:hypothetical protein
MYTIDAGEGVQPCYDYWAPFTGSARASSMVLNTEHATKRSGGSKAIATQAEIDLTEDLLIELQQFGSVIHFNSINFLLKHYSLFPT